MATNDIIEAELCIVSFNMHGYNQGVITVRDLIVSNSPDVFMLQEHWLTPVNLVKFNSDFPEYTLFGSSALSNNVESGPLIGRPLVALLFLLKMIC